MSVMVSPWSGSDEGAQLALRLDPHRDQRGGVVDRPRDVNGVLQPDVSIPPEPLPRVVPAHRVPAGPGEDLIDGRNCPPRTPSLVAPHERPVGEADLLAAVGQVVESADAA